MMKTAELYSNWLKESGMSGMTGTQAEFAEWLLANPDRLNAIGDLTSIFKSVRAYLKGQEDQVEYYPAYEVRQLENQERQLRQLSQELLEAAKEVARISDRKHDAWDRLKTAIQKAEEKLKQQKDEL